MSERRRLSSSGQCEQKKAVMEKENVNDACKYKRSILAGSNYNGAIRARHLSVDLVDGKSQATDDKRAPLQPHSNNGRSNVACSARDQWATRFNGKCELFENFTNSRRMYFKGAGICKIPPTRASSTQQFEADAAQSSKKLCQKSNKLVVRDSAPISGKGYIDFRSKIPAPCLCNKRLSAPNASKQHASVQTLYLTERASSPKSKIEEKGKLEGKCSALVGFVPHASSISSSVSSSIFARTNDSTKLSNDTTCKLRDGSRIAGEKLNSVAHVASRQTRKNEMLSSSCGAAKHRFRSPSASCRASCAIATSNRCKSRNLQASVSAGCAQERSKGKLEEKAQEAKEGKNEGRRNFDLPATSVYNVTYMSDLISVERDRDRRSMQLSLDFPTAKSLDGKLRESAIAFLICVSMECRYSSPILYQAVKIFDRSFAHFPLDFNEMKMVALSALWISLKKDTLHHKIPSAKSLTTFYDDKSETVEKLLSYERSILEKLKFNLTFSDPFSILTYYLVTCNTRLSQSDQTTTKVYYCGGYMIELTLLDSNFVQTPAFVLALVAAEIALCVVMECENEAFFPQWHVWRQKCISGVEKEVISAGFEEKDLDEMRATILHKVSTSTRSSSNGEVVYAKYTRSRYGGVANFLVERVHAITQKKRL